jgi:anthranilate/para-aminobenzoate synthase component I
VTVSIRSIPVQGWWDPAQVFLALYRNDSHAFWLDAGPDAGTGFSYLGAASAQSRFVTASVTEGTITVTRPAKAGAAAVVSPGSAFEFLRSELNTAGRADANTDGISHANAADGVRFRLGWVGWLGYELGSHMLGTPMHRSRYSDAALLEVDRVLVFDHAAREITLLAIPPEHGPEEFPDACVGEWADACVGEWVEDVQRVLAATPRDPPPARRRAGDRLGSDTGTDASPGATWRHDADDYAELIRQCQAAIHAGDAYQLCLTNEVRADVRPDPVETYLSLRQGSPSHHGGLLRFGDTALLSASPEQFLSVTSRGRITTKPIKGTRPRGNSVARDAELSAELVASQKERAENVMIVDLMRNDLGRIAEVGTVNVTSLLAVENYAHVHQLVSTIQARLAAGVSPVDAVASCFPAGSMTGAPKISAMTHLDRLEDGPRGIYSGAFGYFGLDGAVDLAVVIRSIVLDAEGASIGTGGGITALSDPDEEIEETRIKAAALLDALGVGSESPRGAARVPDLVP